VRNIAAEVGGRRDWDIASAMMVILAVGRGRDIPAGVGRRSGDISAAMMVVLVMVGRGRDIAAGVRRRSRDIAPATVIWICRVVRRLLHAYLNVHLHLVDHDLVITTLGVLLLPPAARRELGGGAARHGDQCCEPCIVCVCRHSITSKRQNCDDAGRPEKVPVLCSIISYFGRMMRWRASRVHGNRAD
jgi:hypothetical protein